MATAKPVAGASLSDLLTTAQNIVKAINNLSRDYLNVEGLTSLAAVSASTVVKASAGRVCRIIVTTAGTSTGTVYDGATLTAMSKPVFIIPEAVGVYEVNDPTNFGCLVAPGSGQVVTVVYS